MRRFRNTKYMTSREVKAVCEKHFGGKWNFITWCNDTNTKLLKYDKKCPVSGSIFFLPSTVGEYIKNRDMMFSKKQEPVDPVRFRKFCKKLRIC